MDVEIVVDSKYSEPKVVIYTDNVSNDISNLVNQIKNSNMFSLHGFLNDKLYILNLQDIYLFYSENGKVYAKTSDNNYNVKYKLYELENMLTNKDFIRISNSEIINLKKVKNLDFAFLGTIKINFLNGTYTYASRRFIKKIKEYLNL